MRNSYYLRHDLESPLGYVICTPFTGQPVKGVFS